MSKKNEAIVMGIDVGGTKILLQTFDEQMSLVNEVRILTETKKGQKGFLNQLMKLIENYLTPNIKAIGVAVPGIVNKQKNTLVKAPNLPTKKNLPLKKLIEGRFKRPVYLDNDINAFLWAEKERPKLKKYQHIVAVMVGTGVGGAILSDGQLLYGASGYAGEVGHMIIRQEDALKTLEQNTGGTYTGRITKKLKVKNSEDARVKRYVLEQLGIGLANLNLLFNPEVIVLGGSVYHNQLAKDKRKLEKMIARRSLDGKSPKLVDASKTTSVALGVAMMALQK